MKKAMVVILSILAILNACAPVQRAPSAPELFIEWEMFPDPRQKIVNPGEEIVFKLHPSSTTKNIRKISLHFGDGTKNDHELTYKGEIKRGKYECMPIHDSHIYVVDNLYKPYVKYDYGTCPSKIDSDETTFFIPPRVPTDDELKEMAFQESINQLSLGIKEVLSGEDQDKIKFALTSYKNANFETSQSESDKRDVVVIKKITTSLVNRGYNVLEKNPQSLIRLAHESVVKKDKAGRPSNEYQDSLEYGLRTEYLDPKKPFLYGAEIEGVKQKDKELINKGRGKSDSNYDGKASRQDRAQNTSAGSSRAVKADGSLTEEGAYERSRSYQDRSLYFAKFSTANYTITIDRKSDSDEDIYLLKSEPLYYNVKFQTEMIERTAVVQYNARILNKNGSIVWIKDINGVVKDRVVPDFIKASKERKKGKGFWNSLLKSK